VTSLSRERCDFVREPATVCGERAAIRYELCNGPLFPRSADGLPKLDWMAPSPLRRAWSAVPLRSRVAGVDADMLGRWLADLPPVVGYAVSAKPLRYRQAPHLGAFCWYEDQLIELQLPEPFRPWSEKVYYRARRKPGRRLAFHWYSRTVRFRTRREVLRFLYCHEFYHWYLREVLHRKAAAETACDRFALAHFRARHERVDWRAELPGYDPEARRPVKPAA
jgi:hypothetical protein